MTSQSESERRVSKAAEHSGVSVDGVMFVLRTIDKFTQLGYDVDAAEFSWHIHDRAMHLFGDEARSVLEDWQLKSTNDFGRVVFALIDQKLVPKRESDSMEDFDNVFDFEWHFRRPRFHSNIFRSRQFTILGLLSLTVVAAVATAGFLKDGIEGAYSNLIFGWLFFLGVLCTFFGVQERDGTRTFLCGAGILLIALGFFMMFGNIGV